MKARNGVIGAITLAAIFGVTSYLSPYLTLRQMKTSIQAGDADGFSKHVDFAALRESFKGQMMAMVDRQMDKTGMRSNSISKLGQAMAAALMNPMVDAVVSPAGVIQMMKTGIIRPATTRNDTETPGSEHQPNDVAKYSVAYKTWSQVEVRPTMKDAGGGAFIFRRDGLWSWKLSAVELTDTLAAGPQ